MPGTPFKNVTLIADTGAPLRTTPSPDGIHADLVVELDAGEIEIGHVVIKNDGTEDHVTVAPDGTAVGGLYPDVGFAIMGNDGTTWRVLNTDATGNLGTFAGAPAGTLSSPVDTAIGIGATVVLPAAPAGVLRQTVQNTGGAGTRLRVREAGGALGTGFILPRFGSREYEANVTALEVQHVAGGATSAGVQYE